MSSNITSASNFLSPDGCIKLFNAFLISSAKSLPFLARNPASLIPPFLKLVLLIPPIAFGSLSFGSKFFKTSSASISFIFSNICSSVNPLFGFLGIGISNKPSISKSSSADFKLRPISSASTISSARFFTSVIDSPNVSMKTSIGSFLPISIPLLANIFLASPLVMPVT